MCLTARRCLCENVNVYTSADCVYKYLTNTYRTMRAAHVAGKIVGKSAACVTFGAHDYLHACMCIDLECLSRVLCGFSTCASVLKCLCV